MAAACRSSLVEALPQERFVRVHRSAVVAIAAVRQVRKLPGGDAELELDGGTRVPLGRSFRDPFFARWSGEPTAS
jgi:DNA-binding LytR/AlgR family response regulator